MKEEGAVGSAPWAQSTWDSDKGGRREEEERKEGERKNGWMKAVINASSMRSGWHSRGCELRLGRN